MKISEDRIPGLFVMSLMSSPISHHQGPFTYKVVSSADDRSSFLRVFDGDNQDILALQVPRLSDVIEVLRLIEILRPGELSMLLSEPNGDDKDA